MIFTCRSTREIGDKWVGFHMGMSNTIIKHSSLKFDARSIKYCPRWHVICEVITFGRLLDIIEDPSVIYQIKTHSNQVFCSLSNYMERERKNSWDTKISVIYEDLYIHNDRPRFNNRGWSCRRTNCSLYIRSNLITRI